MRLDRRRALDLKAYPVLYVDDEAENLRAFELTFRREFAVRTARNAHDALAMINGEPVSVILSDHRMPGMTGTEFLARAREVAPRAIRLLVTAYGDVATLADAVNNGQIYRYIPKPWHPNELRLEVQHAIELFALESDRERLISDLSALFEVSRQLAREREAEPMARAVVDLAVEKLGFDGATLVLFDATHCQLRAAGTAPRGCEVAGYLASLGIDRSSAPSLFEAVEAGRVERLLLESATAMEAGARRILTEVSAEELLVLPLCGAAGALGALLVDNRSGGPAMSQAERSLLEGLAAQATNAIERARVNSYPLAVDGTDRTGELARIGALALAEAGGREGTAAVSAASAFSGQGSGVMHLVWLDQMVRQVADAHRGLAAAAEVEVELDVSRHVKVAGLEVDLRAAVSLLVVEAISRCGKNGRVKIVVGVEDKGRGQIAISCELGGSAEDLEAISSSLRIQGASVLAERIRAEVRITAGQKHNLQLSVALPSA